MGRESLFRGADPTCSGDEQANVGHGRTATARSLEVSRLKSTSVSLVFGTPSCQPEDNEKHYGSVPSEMNYGHRSHGTGNTEA